MIRARQSPWVLLALLTAAASARSASAQAGASAPKAARGLSRYEADTLQMSLARLGAEVDPAPEGKRVEAVDVVTLEVFDEREGFLQIANVLHATTLPEVLRREVLLRVGEPYARELADETARNLRAFPQNSLVLVVPVRGRAAGTVRLLVLTKDVWSLRMSWDVKASGAGLELLRLEPTETNVAGTHQSVSGRFIMRPETYTLGTAFRVPRLQGQRLSLGADANVILSDKGEPEGSYGSTYIARPLTSTREKWAWFVSSDFRNERVRRYVNARVALFNAKATPERDNLRDEYHAQRFTETLAVVRSFGAEHKQDVTFGAEVNVRSYHLPPGTLGRFAPDVVSEYVKARIPVGDTRVGPALQARIYTTRFKRVLDLETLGLQEDIRLGYDMTARVYPVFRELGSSRSFLGTLATAQYTWALADGIVRVGGELLNEVEADQISDGAASADLRVHSPSLGFGRLVFDAGVLGRYRNYLNRKTGLGGDSRLRGYPTNFFAGKDYVVGNLEYRTPALKVFTVLLGGALFYDVGHAFDGWEELRPQQSAGTGFRILFPQFDKVVFRGDFAVPLTADLPGGVARLGSRIFGVPAPTVFVAFEQAFALSSAGAPVSVNNGASSGILGQ